MDFDSTKAIYLLISILISSFGYVVFIPVVKKYNEDLLSTEGLNIVFCLVWPFGIIIFLVNAFCVLLQFCKNSMENWLNKPKMEPCIDEAKSGYRNIVFKK